MNMRYNEEIEEIRSMMNTISSPQDNYPKTIYDEELSEGVTYLTRKDTDLSVDIIVDSGETYKVYSHPLCLFVVDGDIVHPVTISHKPSSNNGYNIPQDVINFIEQNFVVLIEFANLKIDGSKFFNAIREWKREKDNQVHIVAEMSTYSPESTGLPVWVYVDDTGSYLNSGHNGSYRIKFQQDKEIKNPRLWMPIALPSLEIMDKETVPPCTIPQRKVNKVIEWAKGNLELLIKLRDKEISGTDFEARMLKMKDIKVLLDSKTK